MDRNRAFELLGLTPTNDVAAINEAFYQRRNRFRSKLDAAGTPEEEARYEKALRVLEAARVQATLVPPTRPAIPGVGPETIIVPTPAPGTTGQARRTGFGNHRTSAPQNYSRATSGGTGARSQVPGAPMRANEVIANRYEVVGLLGEGGMGQVFRAFDRNLGKDIAMKVLHPMLVNNEQARERFQREARISMELSHPNIVKVHDVYRDDSHHFITMEMLQGHTLRDEIELHQAQGKHAFPVEKAVKITLAIARALEFAHEVTIHRDIKPENIFLCHDGSVKLMDFGIAGVLAPSQLTMTGAAMGTAYYMPPEQLAGDRSIDHRADQYSLAVVLYEMLAGGIPQGKVVPLKSLRKNVGAPISRAVDRALSPQASGRFKSVSDFASELRLRPSWHERGLVRAAAAVLVLLLIGLASWMTWGTELRSTWYRVTADDTLVTEAKRADEGLELELSKLRGLEAFVDVRMRREVDSLRQQGSKELGEFRPTEAIAKFDEARKMVRKLSDAARERERDYTRLTEKRTSITILRDDLRQLSVGALTKYDQLESWLGRDDPQDEQGFQKIKQEIGQLRAARQYVEKKLALEEDQVLLAQASQDEAAIRNAYQELGGLDERLLTLKKSPAFAKIGELASDMEARLDIMLEREEPLALERIKDRKQRAELAASQRKEALDEYSQSLTSLGGRPPLKPRILRPERGLAVRDVERSHVEFLLWRVQTESSTLVESFQSTAEAKGPELAEAQAEAAFQEGDYSRSAELSERARTLAASERAKLYKDVLVRSSEAVEAPLDDAEVRAVRAVSESPSTYFEAQASAESMTQALESWRARLTRDETARQEALRCSSCEGQQECVRCERRGRIEEDCPDCDHGNITSDCSDCRAQGRIYCNSCSRSGSISETCGTCSGGGTLDCVSCNGGSVACNVCNGQGGQSCGVCNGRGTMGSFKGFPIPCPGCGMSGRKTCSNCQGRKRISCQSCGGQGSLKCRTCSGNGRVSVTCRACNGQGFNQCRTCLGKKTIVERCRKCPNGLITVTCPVCEGDRVCRDCDGKGRRD